MQRRAVATGREALVETARAWLRPVLMTSLAIISCTLPLAFELGSGAEFRAPMAHAVIGGLITSTLLTQIVVPVVYTCLDDHHALFACWLGTRHVGPRPRTRSNGVSLV